MDGDDNSQDMFQQVISGIASDSDSLIDANLNQRPSNLEYRMFQEPVTDQTILQEPITTFNALLKSNSDIVYSTEPTLCQVVKSRLPGVVQDENARAFVEATGFQITPAVSTTSTHLLTMTLPERYSHYLRLLGIQNHWFKKEEKVFLYCCEIGDIEMLPFLSITPPLEALKTAALNGKFEIVRMLLPLVDPTYNGNEAFRSACMKGYLQIVELMLGDPRIDPSDCNNEAIRRASYCGHFKIVALLLRNPKVDPSAKSNKAFRDAATNGKLAVVRLLLKDSRVDPSDYDNEAIRLASFYGRTAVVKELLKDSRIDPGASNNDAIKKAAYRGNYDVFELLKNNERVDANQATLNYNNVLLKCIYTNDISMIAKLLQENLVDPQSDKSIALRLAVHRGNLQVFQLLLNRGFDPSSNDNQAITDACAKGFIDIAKVLLNNPSVDPSDNSNIALQKACLAGNTQIIKLLLDDARVDPSIKNNRIIRDLAKSGSIENIKLICNHAKVNPSDLDNEAIIVACKFGNFDAVSYFLKDGRVDPTARNNKALQLACKFGHRDIVALLLNDSRIDPSGNNNAALKNAKNNGHKEIVELLLKDQRVKLNHPSWIWYAGILLSIYIVSKTLFYRNKS
ncbi:hypothetical protein HDV06_006770 [Boothiomyces sp. JEL0866]|nr:hypothetical protein HDV06_006770 [Boothiomyces sp. JEL0866]